MNILTITNPDGREILKLEIGEVDPGEANIAIVSALKALKPIKKRRSDAGKKRSKTATPELIS